MLTQTSEIAIRALIMIAMTPEGKMLTPKEISYQLGSSPTYMAKITGQLVKSNILRSQRGAQGGVTLSRPAKNITLLAIVQSCQGLIVGNYCEEMRDHPAPVCAFHTAMKEAHVALVSVFMKWTLADMVKRPGPAPAAQKELTCKMGFTDDVLAKFHARMAGSNGATVVEPPVKKSTRKR